MNERLIIIGLITSTEFCRRIKPHWQPRLLESSTAEELATWCWQYYEEYKKAPGKEIETIYFRKITEGLDKEMAEEIEEELLPDLSEEYERTDLNVQHLIKETKAHITGRRLLLMSARITDIVDNGRGDYEERLKDAETLLEQYKSTPGTKDTSIDLGNASSEENIRQAFRKAAEPVIRLPKQLGEFMNHQCVPGGFLSFLAPEKRGKTWILMALGMTAVGQRKKVAMFQAGDMNEAEQIRRISSYLCRKPTIEKYAKEHWQPVRDCVHNQLNECHKKERECDFGVFEDMTLDKVLLLDYEELEQAAQDNPDYKPCHNCTKYRREKCGVVWLEKVPDTDVIDEEDAVRAFTKFFVKNKRSFRLSTHANGTLSVRDMETILDTWEVEDGFVPDVIIVDYADLLVPSGGGQDFRQQQNTIWKDLRRLSQTKRQDVLPLVITPTQADAQAYKSYRLELNNFSEDKRKYAHVTAMYGLNQDPMGREKKLGLLRINEIIIREGEFSNGNEVTVLQNLKRGRPIIGSFFGINNK